MIIHRLSDNYIYQEWYQPFIDCVKKYPNSCDEVWLAGRFGFPPLEVHEKVAAGLIKTAEVFRRSGIKVSLQISNTLGHGQSAEKSDCSGLNFPGSKAGHMVGADGSTCEYCYCYRSPAVIEYAARVTAIYSRMQPDTVWFDDDLRAEYHDPLKFVCFCDDCLALFNKKNSSNFSRSELVKQINENVFWREKWVDFIREGLGEFTAVLAKAAIEVSPKSSLGYQYPHVTNYAGADNSFYFNALYEASGKPVKSRAGHSYYDDQNPMGLLEKVFRIHYCNRMLPDFVKDRLPEIENIPHVTFGKSVFGTLTESSLFLAYGCTGLTYSALGTNEPWEYRENILEKLASHREYWNRLAEISKKSFLGGVAVAIEEKMHLFENVGEPEFEWVQHRWTEAVNPAKIGLSVGFDDNVAKVILLTKKLAQSLSDTYLKSLLKRPVLTQADAAEYLTTQRGLDLGLRFKRINLTTVTEEFTSHPVNNGRAGHRWRDEFYTGELFELCGETVEPLSVHVSTTQKGVSYGTASGIVSLPSGCKWAIIGTGLTDYVLSSARRNQFINAADYICGHSLPALIITADKFLNIPRVDKNGKLICVSILRSGLGKSENIKLRLRNPVSERFYYQNGTTKAFNIEAERDGDDFILTLPPLDGWDIGTVFCGDE